MTEVSQQEASELFRQPPHEMIEWNGGALAYRKIGTGPDVLLVHGWPVNGATWRCLLPHLASHVTCHVIDLVGAGHSTFTRQTQLGFDNHIASIRHVVDWLGTNSVAMVGQDSGALCARHAMAGDARLRSMGLVNTEQPQGLTQRFKNFLLLGKIPGFGRILTFAGNNSLLRRNPMTFGGCFADRSLLDGEFAEFFMQPLAENPELRWATVELVRSFGTDLIDQLAEKHAQIDVPVRLAWGDDDPFFPLDWAREMAAGFDEGSLEVVKGGRLFIHEERAAEVAEILLPTLIGAH